MFDFWKQFSIYCKQIYIGNINKFSKGFTLLELIVVLAMLGILFAAMISIINPGAQINKAQDSQREHSLDQVKQALDTYYNDTGCYPKSFSFGSSWTLGSTVYMQSVPQDPKCSGNSNCFSYEVDSTSNCPQWNILYAGLQSKNLPLSPCPLSQLSSCLPQNYNSSGYNYCLLSGKVDCSYITSNPVPTGYQSNSGGNGGNGGGGGGSGPTSTPTPGTCPNGYYACTGNPARCNVEDVSQCRIGGGSNTCYCSFNNCVNICGQ